MKLKKQKKKTELHLDSLLCEIIGENCMYGEYVRLNKKKNIFLFVSNWNEFSLSIELCFELSSL